MDMVKNIPKSNHPENGLFAFPDFSSANSQIVRKKDTARTARYVFCLELFAIYAPYICKMFMGNFTIKIRFSQQFILES